MVREMTLQFIEDLRGDDPPRSMATYIDFGIPPQLNPQYGALQFGIKNKLFTPEELDAALGSGPKLTKLVQRGENPYRCTFRTAWDNM